MYRILTESKNVETIKSLILDPKFESYTILDAGGRWKGHQENALIIEFVEFSGEYIKHAVYEAAREIKRLNEQEAVLVQHLDCNSELI